MHDVTQSLAAGNGQLSVFNDFFFSVYIYSPFRANHKNTLRDKNGVHAFDYNSAESEAIRMKSGAL